MWSWGLRLLILLLLFVGILPRLANSDPPPLEAYGGLPFVSAADLSPDGTQVAIVHHDVDQAWVYVFQLDGTITYKAEIGDSWFSNPDSSISFIDDNYVLLGNSRIIPLDRSKSWWLFRRTKGSHNNFGSILGKDPDSGKLLMAATSKIDSYRPWVRNVYAINLKTGKARVYADGTSDTLDWFVDENGEILARERYDNNTNTYRVERFSNGWTTIYEDMCDQPCLSIIGLNVERDGLVFAYGSPDSDDIGELGLLSLNGAIDSFAFSDRGREIDLLYTETGPVVVGAQFSGSRPTYQFLVPEIQNSVDHMRERFPNATITLASWSDEKTTFLFHVFDRSLGDVWVTHTAINNEISVLANNRPDIPVTSIASTALVHYPARDGLSIEAVVTLPNTVPSSAQKKLPLIVMPHGGPEAYDSLQFDWMAQFFASRGYAVLQPNFRGSSGYGKEFLHAGRGEWGGKMQDDITDGVLALSENGLVDKDRVCILGASYGGYAALAGAVFTPELYQCVIAIAPVSDINLMLLNTKIDFGRKHWVLDYWKDMVAFDNSSRDRLASISPVNFANDVRAPVLLIHGTWDKVVDVRQSEKMARSLRRYGKDVELVKLRKVDHQISDPEARIKMLREVDSFLSQHLPVDAAQLD